MPMPFALASLIKIRHSRSLVSVRERSSLRGPGGTASCYLDLQVSQRESESVKEFTDLPGQVD